MKENRRRQPKTAETHTPPTPRGLLGLVIMIPVIAALITATCATLIVFRMTEPPTPADVHVVSAFRVYLSPEARGVLVMVWSDGEVWTADANIGADLGNWTAIADVREETE